MRTVVLGPRPAELQAVIDRRRALGQDTYDEVWEGDYHMAPAVSGERARLQARLTEVLGPVARSRGLEVTGPINVGDPEDFRTPDAAVLPGTSSDDVTWHATAHLVAEVRSPDDETYEKFGFWAHRGVEEVVVVDAVEQSVRLHGRSADGYQERSTSALLGVTADDLAAALDLT